MPKPNLCRVFQDGMLKYKGTYEIMSPDDIGLTRVNNSGIVLGKLRYHANVAPITRLHIEYLYSMINPSLFMEEISTNFLFLYYLYKSSRSSRVTEVASLLAGSRRRSLHRAVRVDTTEVLLLRRFDGLDRVDNTSPRD